MTRRHFFQSAVAGALAVAAGGCSRRRTTYIYSCRDGTESRDTIQQVARSGCNAHGGVLSETPRTVTSGSRGFRPSFGTRRSRRLFRRR